VTQLRLTVYQNPGAAELFINLRQKVDGYKIWHAYIDTGAPVTLLPARWMPVLDYRLSGHGSFVVEQAGIAEQTFEAVEATIEIFLEDRTGVRTTPFEAPVWFAATDEALIGFDGILDQAILHLDMPHLNGTLDLDL
jgi:hypothetical protein